MTNDMSIQEYLAAGGTLTNPSNTPPRYRAELLKIMAIFIDSELAGAAGFAELINAGPGIQDRIAAARIVLEKTTSAERVLTLMGEFGADTHRYANHHPWTARLPRDAVTVPGRGDHDMRLSVFNYPLQGWADAVVMTLLMGHAAAIQLNEISQVSYQPLADAIRTILPIEAQHTELAGKGLSALAKRDPYCDLQGLVDYWWPRVETSFGDMSSAKHDMLTTMGLRRNRNATLKMRWQRLATTALAHHGLHPPH